MIGLTYSVLQEVHTLGTRSKCYIALANYYLVFFFFCATAPPPPQRPRFFSFTRFLDHTRRTTTVSMTHFVAKTST
jgi:hypothetical protein